MNGALVIPWIRKFSYQAVVTSYGNIFSWDSSVWILCGPFWCCHWDHELFWGANFVPVSFNSAPKQCLSDKVQFDGPYLTFNLRQRMANLLQAGSLHTDADSYLVVISVFFGWEKIGVRSRHGWFTHESPLASVIIQSSLFSSDL